jgi:nitrite reductase/ring-hydroxylating ferredoxin subunit
MNQRATGLRPSVPHRLGYPDGWFSVGSSSAMAPGQLMTRKFFGHEVVIFRSQTGQVSVVDAYCPHMGAHFAHGGTVEGEHLRCPFHGFEFDGQGTCHKTGYGTKPPSDARLFVWPSIEINGFILVWHASDGREPDWHVPALPGEGRYLPMHVKTWTLKAHPQETTENSVDLGHLTVVHGYKQVEMLSELKVDGPYLNAKYAMSRSAGFIGKAALIRAEFEVHVWGLGYSWVNVHIPENGIHTRHFVQVTPVDEETSTLTVALVMEEHTEPHRIHPALRMLPKLAVNQIVARAAFAGFCGDVMQDFDVWQNKRYVHPPVLATGDGPVIRYRRWARQFYPAQAGVRGGSPDAVTQPDQD